MARTNPKRAAKAAKASPHSQLRVDQQSGQGAGSRLLGSRLSAPRKVRRLRLAHLFSALLPGGEGRLVGRRPAHHIYGMRHDAFARSYSFSLLAVRIDHALDECAQVVRA